MELCGLVAGVVSAVAAVAQLVVALLGRRRARAARLVVVVVWVPCTAGCDSVPRPERPRPSLPIAKTVSQVFVPRLPTSYISWFTDCVSVLRVRVPGGGGRP
jgi:hypothetical protein